MADGFGLTASVRKRTGKGAARALRREGLIPAVIYGNKEPAVSISIPEKDVTLALYAGGFLTNVWTLDVDGKAVQALARDYQREPLKERVVHVDFLRVSATSRVKVDVPITTVGEDDSPGVAAGGVVTISEFTLAVEAPATGIPDKIEIDVSSLEAGGTVTTADIRLPDGVTLAAASDEPLPLVSIAAPSAAPADDEADESADAAATEGDGAAEEGDATGGEASED
ncbi:MAG: 50S ribosomal protein L25/general stress protein Ctc [Pseudomonadota bacterium]